MRTFFPIVIAYCVITHTAASAAKNVNEKENPFGACHCEGELWLAEDCKTGYICNGQAILEKLKLIVNRNLC